ncbi:uncharacterized protein LOC108601519 [Drosophila busckii]|nr:uncharacterized protein LOC108601519 [Drosophila busckii]
MFTRRMILIYVLWALGTAVCRADLPLFFPTSSVYQITACFSAPVVIPQRKLFWDWGMQMNYNLPFQPSSFYASKIWEDQFDRRHSRQQRQLQQQQQKYLPQASGDVHPSDLTAGELYESMEHMLTRYGFDESCLLRSVCELARHPFHEQQQNMLTALLSFTLTPSMHEAFGAHETLYREVYEQAEQQGFLGANCAQLYPHCAVDFLSAISKLIS